MWSSPAEREPQSSEEEGGRAPPFFFGSLSLVRVVALVTLVLIAPAAQAEVQVEGQPAPPPVEGSALLAAALDKYNNGRNARADYDDAIAKFDAAIAAGLPPADTGRAHAWKGMTYLRIGDLQKTVDAKLPWYKKGEAEAKRGIAAHSACADCYYVGSACLGRWGEQRGVMRSLMVVGDVVGGFKKALALEPGHIEASLAMGKVDEALPFFAGGSVERAEGRFRGVLKKQPRFTRAMLDLAELLHKEGRDEEAKKWATKALDERAPFVPGEHRKWDKERARALLTKLAR
jgi:tetratricopeptide (TPR) repeat protein